MKDALEKKEEIKMRYFFSNHELRNLHKEEELEDYFQFRKKYDEIKDLPSSDLAVSILSTAVPSALVYEISRVYT